MKLTKLKLKNFLTYAELDYDFIGRPLLIQGRNLTDEDQASNGSGKSGMQTAIEFCITASNSRGVRDNELIQFGFEKSVIELFASCDVRKQNIHIEWTIKKKGSNKLNIWIQSFGEGWEECSFSNVNDGKKQILDWFAISKEDLFNYYLINNNRFKSFFESSQKEKVELINRFSDASIIEGIENIDTEALDSKFKNLADEVIRYEERVNMTQRLIEIELERDLEAEMKDEIYDIDQDIKDTLDQIEDQKKEIEECGNRKNLKTQDISTLEKDINKVAKQINLATEDINQHEELTQEIKKQVDEAKQLVDTFKGLQLTEEKEEIEEEIEHSEFLVSAYEDKKEEMEDTLQKLKTKLEKITVKLGGVITCPSCSHEFLLDGDLGELNKTKESILKLIPKVKERASSHQASITTLKENIADFNKQYEELENKEYESLKGRSELAEAHSQLLVQFTNHQTNGNRLHKELSNLEKELDAINNNIEANQRDIERTEEKIEACKESIASLGENITLLKNKKKALKPENNEEYINELKERKTALELEKTSIEKKKDEVGDEIFLINQWKTNFKLFKMHVANQSLQVIEYHSNRYLKEMGSDMRVRLDGYKQLSNGSFKDEITATIIRNTERTFGSFSGGEKGRLLFASILANRYMINSTHPYGGLDFLSIDEVVEGIDAKGLKSLIHSAKLLKITAMIITHVTDEKVSDDILLIEKVNGISSIVKN